MNQGSSSSGPTPSQQGVLFTDDFSNFNRWSPNGTIVVGSGQISNGAATGLNYIYDNFSAFGGDKFKISATLTVNVASGAVGVCISNEHQALTDASRRRSIYFTINTSTGALGITRRNNSSNTSLISKTIAAPAVGNSIRLTLMRYNRTYYGMYENLTTGLKSDLAAVEVLTEGNSIGNFGIVNFSGTYTPTAYSAETDCLKNAKLLTIGDSITNGFGATSIFTRWSNMLLQTSEDTLEVWAANGAQTVSGVTSLPYLKMLAPQNVILMIGGNDTEDGNVTVQQLHDNYLQIRNELKTNGSNVIHCLPTPRQGAVELTNYKNWMQSSAPLGSDTIVDTWTPLSSGGVLNPIYDSGDGRHPNDAGYAVIATAIKATLPTLVTLSTRSITFLQTNQLIGTLTKDEKDLIETFVNGVVAQGYYNSLKDIQLFGLRNNRTFGLKGTCRGFEVGSPTNSRSGILFNGTTQYLSFGGGLSNCFGFADSNIGGTLFCADMITAAGTSAPFGCTDGTRLFHLSQIVGTNLTFRVCQSAATTHTGKSALVDGRPYSISRSGASANALIEDGTTIQTGSTAANGLPAAIPYVAAFNNNTTVPTSFCNEVSGGFAIHTDLGANYADFHTRLKTLITGIAALAA